MSGRNIGLSGTPRTISLLDGGSPGLQAHLRKEDRDHEPPWATTRRYLSNMGDSPQEQRVRSPLVLGVLQRTDHGRAPHHPCCRSRSRASRSGWRRGDLQGGQPDHGWNLESISRSRQVKATSRASATALVITTAGGPVLAEAGGTCSRTPVAPGSSTSAITGAKDSPGGSSPPSSIHP